MRIGVYGGTFDPIHYGHLLLAECCREQAHLDRVLFVPALSPPHKQTAAVLPAEYRVNMLQLAVGGHPAFQIDRIELSRPGPSFTVDTLAMLQSQHPADELFLLMGADSLLEFPQWRAPRDILRLASLLVTCRGDQSIPAPSQIPGFADHLGEPLELANASELRPPGKRQDELEAMARELRATPKMYRVTMPACGISATDLRRRAEAGASLRYRTPPAVEMYIQSHGLYASSSAKEKA